MLVTLWPVRATLVRVSPPASILHSFPALLSFRRNSYTFYDANILRLRYFSEAERNGFLREQQEFADSAISSYARGSLSTRAASEASEASAARLCQVET